MALGQSYDSPIVSEATLKNMGKTLPETTKNSDIHTMQN